MSSENDDQAIALSGAITKLAGIMGEMLASADETLVVHHPTLGLALRLGRVFDELAAETLAVQDFTSRSVRSNDKMEWGEHPGVWMTAQVANGFVVANIHGGIRDFKSGREQRDTMGLRAFHSDRTIGLGNKPTHFNLHTLTAGGTKMAEAWITDTPRGGGSVAIGSLYLNPDLGQDLIVYRGNNADTVYAYNQFHGQLRRLVKDLVERLP